MKITQELEEHWDEFPYHHNKKIHFISQTVEKMKEKTLMNLTTLK